MKSTAEQIAFDEQAIKRLLDAWGLWRDTCRFDELRACYAPGATMVTTWFDGAASDFVDASIKSSAAPTLTQHFIGPSTIEVHEARAIAETRLILMGRTKLEDIDIDVTCYGRFFDRLVRTGDGWRILSRMPIYEKDTLTAVDPGLAVQLDVTRLKTYPAAFRHLAYVQASGGATITSRIPPHNSTAQRELYAEAQTWLRAG